MSEVRAKLENIRNVEVKSKVVYPKDEEPKVVTAVKFEYEGPPSQMQDILILESQHHPVNAELYSLQGAFSLE